MKDKPVIRIEEKARTFVHLNILGNKVGFVPSEYYLRERLTLTLHYNCLCNQSYCEPRDGNIFAHHVIFLLFSFFPQVYIIMNTVEKTKEKFKELVSYL